MFLLFLLPLLQSIQIPLNSPPLLIQPSNQLVLANYTFSFNLQISIQNAATLQIQFPSQYTSVTSFSQSNCTFTKNICAISYSNGIDINLINSIYITNILNPLSGGVGNFQLRTKINQNIVEQNKIYTNAGIRGNSDTFIYAQISTNNNIAGNNSTYQLTFKTNQSYNYQSILYLNLLNYYSSSNFTKVYPSIDNTLQYTVNFSMTNPFSIGPFKDLPIQLYKGTYLLVQGTVKNPQFIAAPLLCSMQPFSYIKTNSMYKQLDYTFTITPPYDPIIGSKLQIIVPEYFQRIITGYQNTQFYYPTTQNNFLSFIGDRDYLMNINNITNIQFVLRLLNPNVPGTTSPFKFTMYYNQNIYMYDNTTCNATITKIVPPDYTHPTSLMLTNSYIGMPTNITFNLPIIPGSSSVVITFPYQFTISTISTINCLSTISILSCVNIDDDTLNITFAQSLTTNFILNLVNAITNPTTNGTYLIQVLIDNYSYTDSALVIGSSTPMQIEIIGNLIKIIYISNGITNGSISLEMLGNTFLGVQLNCYINRISIGCWFNTNTNIQFDTLTTINQSSYEILISGVSIIATQTFTLRQFDLMGMVLMRQQISKTITATIYSNNGNCGSSNIYYGSKNNLQLNSCINIPNPQKIIIQTDTYISTNSLLTTVLVNNQQVNYTYFSHSLLIQNLTISAITALEIDYLLSYITLNTTQISIWIQNTSGNLYLNTYQYTINQPNVPTINLQLSSTAKNDVGVIYNFTFTVPSNTTNGTLSITFPANYYALNTSNAWASSNIINQISVQKTRIVLNNIMLNQLSNYYVIVYGVINPNAPFLIGYDFLFEQLNTLNVLIQTSNAEIVKFPTSFSVMQITSDISFYPQNALIPAQYTFNISLSRIIPPKSLLQIIFPSQFTSLTQPLCYSTAIVGFDSCILLNSTTIQISLTLEVQSYLLIYLKNITNPFSTVTSLFNFNIYCNNILIMTGKSKSGLSVVNSPANSKLISWNLSPTTVGEVATYNFTILPASSITFNQQLYIKFPYQYDLNLGNGINCIYIDCSGNYQLTNCINSNREIDIYIGEYIVNSLCPIKIMIVGIVNPNIQSSFITLGVKQIDNLFYKELVYSNSVYQPAAAPITLTFNQLQASNYFIRSTASYSIAFYTSFSIYSSTMMLYVIFPYYIYQLVPQTIIPCDSPQFTPQCLITYNNRIQITNIGSSIINSGNININLYSLNNPLDESYISEYYVEILDIINGLIIGRTYSNLQYFSLSYTANGPLIKMNNQLDIYMNEGTTINLPIVITESLIVPVSVKGLGPFGFTPYIISLDVGTQLSSFSISSPKGQTGEYTIYWKLFGDLQPIYFTPIKRTNIIVQAVLTAVYISTTSPFIVPLNSCSSNINIQLEYAPDTNLQIIVMANNATYAIFNFLNNQSSQTFQLCNQTKNGKLSFSLAGINSVNYYLSTNILNFNIAPSITTVPTLLNFNFIKTSKTSVQFNISLSGRASFVLLTSLANTTIKTILDNLNFQIQTQTQYLNSTYSDLANNLSVVIYQLTSNISYQSSIYLSNQNQLIYVDTIYFSTLPFDPNCQVFFNFSKNISYIQKYNFLQYAAYTLGINSQYIALDSSITNQSLVGVIIGQNQSYEQYPTPVNLINSLYIRPYRIQSIIKSLILLNPFVTIIGPITPVPSISSVLINQYNINYITFNITLSNLGNLYTILLINPNQTPTAQQIYLGLNSSNILTQSKIFTQVNQTIVVTYNNLQNFTKYKLCVLSSNLDPNPTLSNSTQCIIGMTNYPPGRIHLSINYESRASIIILLMIMIFL